MRFIDIDAILNAFRIGFFTVFATPYWWVFVVQGGLLYLLTMFQTTLLANANISSAQQINFVHFLGTLAQIGVILSMIKLILFLFDTPFIQVPSWSLFHTWFSQSWQKITAYFIKGALLSILLIIIPGLLYGFFSMKTSLSSFHLIIVMKIAFALSLTFFGFACWILIDRCASLKESVMDSVRCGWRHIGTLLVFYVIAIVGMALLNIPPFIEVISYCIYFPIMLAAQGHLYRLLCGSFKAKVEQNIPFYRPPIS